MLLRPARGLLRAIEEFALGVGACVGPALGSSEDAADGATLGACEGESLGACDGIMVRNVPPDVGGCRQDLVRLFAQARC